MEILIPKTLQKTMPYGNYHHNNNKTILVTYAGKWEIEVDYISYEFSSLMESPALFLFKNEVKKPIIKIYEFESTIEKILVKACSDNVLDLVEFFDEDHSNFKYAHNSKIKHLAK